MNESLRYSMNIYEYNARQPDIVIKIINNASTEPE